ncbi:hypothetical protein Golax_016205 [Gossypium laxum]|uniref:Protein kinase domain-containing protein n=1 Tax=Gossypium laxum TaxID=34288 RepID=A0A7J8YWH8_9ROSI|nr:hypothetical protein [Gossypium laxum]
MEQRKASPLPDQLCKCFTLAEIQAATNNFNHAFIIGSNKFSNVDKGFIKAIKCEMAIKRFKSQSQQGAREFWIEIQLPFQLRYVTLVSLIAIATNNEKIIVYEYMTNGTLPRGLDYLHSGVIHRIIHQDIKSTNILLDEEYVVKISDFGLSKMSPSSMTNDPIRTVTDSGFKIRIFVDQFSQLGSKCIWNESIDESIDPFLKGKISLNCLRTYAKIVENCIRENGCQSPYMYDVARKLEFVLQLQEIEDAEQISQVSDGAQSQVNQDH